MPHRIKVRRKPGGDVARRSQDGLERNDGHALTCGQNPAYVFGTKSINSERLPRQREALDLMYDVS